MDDPFPDHQNHPTEITDLTREQILAAVDLADASFARGEGREITRQSMFDLAESIKQRGRARLAQLRD